MQRDGVSPEALDEYCIEYRLPHLEHSVSPFPANEAVISCISMFNSTLRGFDRVEEFKK